MVMKLQLFESQDTNGWRLTITLSPESGTESRNSSSSSPIMRSPSPQSKHEKATVPPFAIDTGERGIFSVGRTIRDSIGSGAGSFETSAEKLDEEDKRLFSFQLVKSEMDLYLGRRSSEEQISKHEACKPFDRQANHASFCPFAESHQVTWIKTVNLAQHHPPLQSV